MDAGVPGPILDRVEELAGRMVRFIHSRLGAAGCLSPSQFLVLKLLADGGRCTVSEIASCLGVSVPAATGLVDRLARARWVVRYRSRADRRVVHVAISSSGAAELERARARRRQAWSELIAALEPEEVERLLACYEKMARTADRLGSPPARAEQGRRGSTGT